MDNSTSASSFLEHTPLFGQIEARLLRWARARGLGWADAQDIVQQICVDVWRKKDRFHGASLDSLLAWLYGFFTRAVRDFRRQARGRGATKLFTDLDADGGHFERVAPVAPPEPSDGLADDERALLAQRIAKLEAPYRDVVMLRLRMDRSWQEIGESVGAPPCRLRQRYHRALRMLGAEVGAA